MFDHISNEAIDFVLGSKLGKALEEVFQNVIDYRDRLLAKGYKYNLELCKKVYDYASRTYKLELVLKDVIKKHANINIYNVMIEYNFVKGLSGVFATIPMDLGATVSNFTDIDTYIDMMEVTAGKKTLNNIKDMDEYVEIEKYMKYVDGSIDLKAGTLKPGKPINISLLILDFNMAFLSEAFVSYIASSKRRNSIFTAREITAIILHEIGHTMSIIENSYNLYYQFFKINEIIKYKQKYEDKTVTIKNFLKNKDRIRDIIKSFGKNESSILLGVYDKLMAAIKTLQDIDVNFDPNNLSMMGRVIYILTVSILVQLAPLFALGLLMALSFYISFLVTEPEFLHVSGKTSDTKVTRRNWFHHERAADEFAIRHGYGPELNSGLEKLINMMHASPFTLFGISIDALIPNVIKQNVIMGIILIGYDLIRSPLVNLIILFTPENTTYETGMLSDYLKRLDRTLQSQMSIFKDPHIPKAIKDQQVEEIKNMQKIREQLKKDIILGNIKFLAVAKLVRYLTVIPTTQFASMLASGHLTEDYAKLQDHLDAFMNNTLAYQSHRLTKLVS
jgi:hypothetical protein